jgi:hypothetical protein
MTKQCVFPVCCLILSAAQDMEAAQLMQQADAVSPASSGGHSEVTIVVFLV